MSNSLATPWTIAQQASLSMGFSRQEYWSGLPFLSPGFLPSPGIELESPALAGGFFTTEPPGKTKCCCNTTQITTYEPCLSKHPFSAYGMCVYIYMYIHTHTHTYTYTHVYIHIYVYIYVYTYTHIYIHIYTHTCIHTHKELLINCIYESMAYMGNRNSL